MIIAGALVADPDCGPSGRKSGRSTTGNCVAAKGSSAASPGVSSLHSAYRRSGFGSTIRDQRALWDDRVNELYGKPLTARCGSFRLDRNCPS
jgi:hypothetical protein